MTAPPVPAPLQPTVDALEHTARSLLALGGQLDQAAWSQPTECPGWSVKDVYSHVIGIEAELLGDPVPDVPAPGAAYLRSDTARHLERAVEHRRARSGPEVLTELGEIIERRLSELRSRPPRPNEVLTGPVGGPVPASRLLQMRIFDLWTHEQDVRRAVGRPGNLTGPGAETTRDLTLRSLPWVVAKVAGAPRGSEVLFDVRGALPFTVTVVVSPEGRGSLVREPTGSPTLRLGMDWETFLRLSAGRCLPAHVEVDASGDLALAARVLDAMAITP